MNINLNKGERMKTKKIVSGTYEIKTNKYLYEVYQNEHLFDKGWELRIIHEHDKEWIETCPTLSDAKSLIQGIEQKENSIQIEERA